MQVRSRYASPDIRGEADRSDMLIANSYRIRFCGKGKGQLTMLDMLGVPASVIERPQRQTTTEVKADDKPSHIQPQLL
jgi:hypothetical protein